jgi:hypothetical protein
MTWLTFPPDRTLVAPSGKHKATAEAEEPDVNPQLAYRMAQFHQQDLHRESEHARAAAELEGHSRFSVLWHKIASIRSTHGEQQAQPVARRPVAGGVGHI